MRVSMKKYLIAALILVFPGILFSQGDKVKDKDKEKDVKSPASIMTSIPVQSKYSNTFAIKNIDFNKLVDLSRTGDLLEVQFILQNLTEDPMDLYVFTIATYEKSEKTRSSFENPIHPTQRIRSFVPYPDDITNFQYPETDRQGNVVKDAGGVEKVKLLKFPRNPKAGIDPTTGKPYHLVDKLVIRTKHLCKYRRNYFYFNEMAILIFDGEGKLVFRQLYKLEGHRTR